MFEKQPHTITWGILGTGHIAHEFARGALASPLARLQAVGSRTSEAARAFSTTFAIPNSYDSYEAVLRDPEVEAVYIALPNSMHADWAVRAAEAGKHILCEKPLTTNHPEAERVFEAVSRHQCFLLESQLYRLHPQTTRLWQLLRDGRIGKPHLIESRFTFDLGTQPENIRLSHDLAGGAIMDVGCYAASLTLLAAGAVPDEVVAVGQIDPASGVDVATSALLRFPGGVIATLSCGMNVVSERHLTIWGSEGTITVTNPWTPHREGSALIIKRQGEAPEHIEAEPGEPWRDAVEVVARYLTSGQVPEPGLSWASSLATMGVLDRWRAAIGLRFNGE